MQDMVRQSKGFSGSVFWFSTLVSRESSLKFVYNALKKIGSAEVKTIPMGQGNKTSRIVAWTFQTSRQHEEWIKKRWNKML